MDADLDGTLDAETYDELVAGLAAEARAELGAMPRSDAVWDAVGDVVPQLIDPVCERILDLAEHDPNQALVEQVTSERASDDAETLRAEALTALVADVEARVAAEDGDGN